MDASRFVAAFNPVISQSAPHIYLSALPFAPAASAVSKQYLPRFPRILFIQTGKAMNWPSQMYLFVGDVHWVDSVAFSPDGKCIVSGSHDNTIRVWNAKTGAVVSGAWHIDWVTSVAFSPDGKRIVSGSGDQTIRVWSLTQPPSIGFTDCSLL